MLTRAPVGAFWVVLGAVTLVGIWAAHAVARDRGQGDPSIVVVDEVAGQLVALAPWAAAWPGWRTVLAAFFFFRLYDVLKPWPARYFDREVKNGFGIVADDLVAGAFAAGTVVLLQAIVARM